METARDDRPLPPNTMAETPTRDSPMMASNTQPAPEGDGQAAEATPRAIPHRFYTRMLNASQPYTDPTEEYTLFGMTKAEHRVQFNGMVRDRLNDPKKLQAFSDPPEFQRAAERYMTAGNHLKAAKERLDAFKTELRAKLREYEVDKEDIDKSFDREYRPVWEELFMKIKETKKEVVDLDNEEYNALKAVSHIINGEVASLMSRATIYGPY